MQSVLKINILAILIVATILSSCTPSTELKEGSCPYEGTYSGQLRSSGEKTQWVDMVPTPSPYLLNYNIEVTLKCDRLDTCGNEGEQCWIMIPTHAKVSDPYFGCTQGCVLDTPDPWNGGLDYLAIPKPGEKGVGNFRIYFKNGKTFTVYPLIVSPDAKTIMADQTNHQKLIENSDAGFDFIQGQAGQEIQEVTFRCGAPSCTYQLQGIEMSLSKIR